MILALVPALCIAAIGWLPYLYAYREAEQLREIAAERALVIEEMQMRIVRLQGDLAAAHGRLARYERVRGERGRFVAGVAQ